MKFNLLAMGVLLGLLSAGSGWAGTDLIPAETFFRPERKADFRLAPGGSHLAYIGRSDKGYALFVQDLSGGDGVRLTEDSPSAFAPGAALDAGPFYWLDEHRILYCRDANGDGKTRIFVVDRRTRQSKGLTDWPDTRSSIISSCADGKIIVSSNKRDPQTMDLFRVDTDSGAAEMVYRNPGGLKRFYVDNAGRLRLIRTQAGWMRYDTDKDELKEFIALKPGDCFYPIAFAADNRSLFAFSGMGRPRTAIVRYDLDSLKEAAVICDDPRYDVWSLEERNDTIAPTARFAYSAAKDKALYASYYGGEYRLAFFDPAIEARFAAMKKLFGEREYAMESWSEDFGRILFRVSDGRLKGRFYLYDQGTGRARLIHAWSDGLPEADLAGVKTAVFPARDGREIEAILTVPARRPLKNLPVVVNVHGGPHLRDTIGFNDINQFFASRGYLVMQVNYRGSQGYGEAFMKAGYRQWGLLMQDDLTDAVAWLKKQGWADPARIAIYGFSSGGYSALAGLTLTPDLYACGIAVSGNVNLISSFKGLPPAAFDMFGDPVADAAKLAAASPASHADAVKAPLLIANGAKDGTIPIQDVDTFVGDLRQRGLDVEYLRYDNFGHNILYRPELKLEVFKKAEAFLEKHLGPSRAILGPERAR